MTDLQRLQKHLAARGEKYTMGTWGVWTVLTTDRAQASFDDEGTCGMYHAPGRHDFVSVLGYMGDPGWDVPLVFNGEPR